ncbi:YceI family protein [Pseudodesulfovibrio mercurii]|uniref:YceI family protein n=1 Tax=Pseudodesulfovibrio mercurii TaxID=641491 RepID=F0JJJ3_9BACT|nr:YceI family protein [Pseudodesulfovibrio mercurii]EGB16092.1 YceI family protein [Pseudodesulfovibrio mercurii]
MTQTRYLRALLLPLILLSVLALAVPAGAQAWKVDPDHSAAHFSIRHMMIAQVRGMFPDVTGTIDFDHDKPTALDITVGVNSIDTGVEARDAHLKSGDFFAAEIHPTMTFKSTRVFPAENGFSVAGLLTIKGASHEIQLTVTGLNDPRVDPWGNTRRGATALFTIDRRDYGVDWNAPLDGGGFMVGNTVHIAVDLEAIQPK